DPVRRSLAVSPPLSGPPAILPCGPFALSGAEGAPPPNERRMPARPVIGVPTQTLQAIDGIPDGIPHSWVMNERYFRALTHVGALPWMIPLLDEDPDTLRGI